MSETPFRLTPIDALQFPKVTVREGITERAGYLTELSCKMLLVELERSGYKLVDTRATG